jgi:hypothetical protein
MCIEIVVLFEVTMLKREEVIFTIPKWPFRIGRPPHHLKVQQKITPVLEQAVARRVAKPWMPVLSCRKRRIFPFWRSSRQMRQDRSWCSITSLLGYCLSCLFASLLNNAMNRKWRWVQLDRIGLSSAGNLSVTTKTSSLLFTRFQAMPSYNVIYPWFAKCCTLSISIVVRTNRSFLDPTDRADADLRTSIVMWVNHKLPSINRTSVRYLEGIKRCWVPGIISLPNVLCTPATCIPDEVCHPLKMRPAKYSIWT